MTEAMAQLSSLVKAIADVEGLDETRVAWVARHCREAGLISQGGRGRGAAKMEDRDAANLLIAVNTSDGGKDSSRSVTAYRQLLATRTEYDEESWIASTSYEDDPPFRFLDKTGLRFGEVLEKLIRLCANIDDGTSVFERELSGDIEGFTICFERPRPAVSLSISMHHDEDDHGEIRSELLYAEFSQIITQRTAVPVSGDRTEKIEITGRTLIAIGKALSK